MMSFPAQLETLWLEYLSLAAKGLRKEALARLDQFVSGFTKLGQDTRYAWVDWFLARKLDHAEKLPLQHRLFRDVLFPRLESGFRAGEFLSTLRLAQLVQYLYRDAECRRRLGDPSELQLLHAAHNLNPADLPTRQLLCRALLDDIRLTLHEVPAGVLWGMSGATQDQCKELQQGLEDTLKWMNAEERLANRLLLRRAALHYSAYAAYLSRRTEFSSYEKYLDCNVKGWDDATTGRDRSG